VTSSMDEKRADAGGPLGLVPMGRPGELALRIVAANLQGMLRLPVDILSPLEVPEEAFFPRRRQYDAGVILRYLGELDLPAHPRLLGVTHLDLCIPILTYVFGEAQLGGRAAVVSTFRLRQGQGKAQVSMERFYERLAKVALHEVAHTFSLYHCENARCLMAFSPALDRLDEIGLVFCDRCEYMLRQASQGVGG